MLFVFLPGCVVWDIRNELRQTNAHVAAVQEKLGATNDKLSGVDDRLTGTNHSLTAVEEQLNLLRSMNQSMGRLDEHLASLRKTIGAIDSMIPFMDLGGGPLPEEPVASADGTADAAQPGAAATPGSTTPPSAKRDVLHGLWVSVYPNGSRALVILPNATFVASTLDPKGDSKPPKVERGSWKRTDAGLMLQMDAAKSAATAMPLLNPSARSFAVQDKDSIWVFTRP